MEGKTIILEENKKRMTQAAGILDGASHLIDCPDPQQRLQAISEVTEQYNAETLSGPERKLAEQIFRVLMHDAAVNVRQALSENLKETNTVPKDIILQLVDDVDDVAIPVLEYSEVLDDSDLIEIIKNSDSVNKFLAISNRKEVNEGVTDALVDTGEEKVVKNILKRAVVKISEMTLDKVADNFSESTEVINSLAHREHLPASVVEKIVKKIGSSMQDELIEKYGHIVPNITDIVEKSQEAATLKGMGLKSSDSEIKGMVDSMEKTREIAQDIHENNVELTKTVENLDTSGHLTPISALCMGNLELFEITLARITNIPVANVRKLLNDDSEHGLEALYNRAKLPENIFQAAKLVIRVIHQIDEEIKDNPSLKKTANDLISRLLKEAEESNEEVENISYFVSMIHEHAKK